MDQETILKILVSLLFFCSVAAIVIGAGFTIGWLIEFFGKRPKVKASGNHYYIYRSLDGGGYYEIGQNYWWTTYIYASKFNTPEEARLNFPAKPLGPIAKLRRKAQYKKIKKEQEDRLKAHKDKMIKVRLDFSDYG